jgi:signal transduction histidine kinase
LWITCLNSGAARAFPGCFRGLDLTWCCFVLRRPHLLDEVTLVVLAAATGFAVTCVVCVGALVVLILILAMAVSVGVVTATFARNAVAVERARGRRADEQAALRHVATLVGSGAAPIEVCAAVACAIGRLFGAEASFVARLDNGAIRPDSWMTVVGSYGLAVGTTPVGTKLALFRSRLVRAVLDTGRAIRVDTGHAKAGPLASIAVQLGLHSGIAVPIVVGPLTWGITIVGSRRRFEPGTEGRVADFVELAALAIRNAEAESDVTRLVEVQASLRRIALLIAEGEPPDRVFATVTNQLLRHVGKDGDTARLLRFELDGTVTFLAHAGIGRPHEMARPQSPQSLQSGILATVRRTGRPSRIDDYRTVAGGEQFVRLGVLAAAAVPVHVNGRLWGLTVIAAGHAGLAPDLEARMAEFTDLVATAVADAQSRAELVSSRARIVAASDETRRRIERDLHDGVQQSLTALALRLRAAAVDTARRGETHNDASGGATDLMTIIEQLRELSRGIHPVVLADSGLRTALRALARRAAIPMIIDVRFDERLPITVEVGAYYVVSEMLTNAAKHAHASAIEVVAEVKDGVLTLRVHDDGAGGADPQHGTGLLGLRDRIEALGGSFDLRSPMGGGTTATSRIPVGDA